MEEIIRKRIEDWTKSPYDADTINEIKALQDAGNEKELIDRFYRELEFGTGGLRGVIGAGTNRMNIYVVRQVTQGLANYILKKGDPKKGIIIGRDSRILSDKFSQAVAGVLIANGIRVYFYKEIHPTPTVSFGIRELKTQTGIMITASHNPKEYNGYKVFWDDGAQITSPVDKEIIEEVQKVNSFDQVKCLDFAEVEKSPMFEYVDERLDPIFMDKVYALSIHPEVIADSGVKICYSPLYGTGYKMVPAELRKFGFKDIIMVKEQSIPDGTFPTVPKPNPEVIEAMQLGIQYAKDNKADIFIATDPDADRIGAALREPNGEYTLLNGNQIATLLVYYVLSEMKNTGKLPKNPRLVTTIVTTKILTDIAKDQGVGFYETLTGFKWIGLKTRELEAAGETFVFGCEESHGYNAANFVRDKDAVNAACLFSEMTAFYKSKGKSVVQVLDDIYIKYGYYKEVQLSVDLKGIEGVEKIKGLMKKLREDAPKQIGKYEVITKSDVKLDTVTDIKSGKQTGKTGLPTSDVIVLELSGNAKVIARPSGTEPKIKFYFTTYGKATASNLSEVKKAIDGDNESMKDAWLKILGL